MLKTIALDAMGGDYGARVVIPAAARVLKQFPDLKLLLVGKEAVLSPLVKQHLARFQDRFEIVPASEVVAMDESPAVALRSKKDSSMRIAINCVKEGRAQACVSSGNTGALMATARFVLKMLPGVDRPAICTTFPAQDNKEVRLLDLGANVDSSAEHLFQFAVMGSVLSNALKKKKKPRVGLLNIGSEEIKGNEIVKRASEMFSESNAVHYTGFIEGDDIFKNIVDVIVCDGFIGNITLKSIEGAVKFIAHLTKNIIKERWWNRLLIAPAVPILKKLVNYIDPEKHNGASLLGLNGIVIKSHGGANVNAFYHAICEAVLEAENNVPQLIGERVSAILNAGGGES